MVSRFSGRDILKEPTCPFCGAAIEGPRELTTRLPNEMPVGACSCGAVYACDITGHNLGTAMIEALLFACDGDWDLAWGLLPEEDYLEAQVENYDIEHHLIVHGGAFEGRRIAGTLYFIRLHQDVREVTEEGARRRLARAAQVSRGPLSPGPRGRKSFSKKDVERMVREYELEPLLDLARQDKRILRDLQRLIYSVDTTLRWRAADALGQTSAVIAEYDPGAVSKLLQRLFTAVSDTAASSWGAIDAIGEIIGNSLELFAGYTPQLYPFAADRGLLAEVLRALDRVAEQRPDILRNKAFHFLPLLQDPDPRIRGHASLLLGHLGAKEARGDLEQLKGDSAEIDTYREGELVRQTVGCLAGRALANL